ncbi:substrate-binding periplasmic protein [Paucibacter sp. KCTC 42545]|uniref:substrate-binding periplasmic protein n=1 Tax=Paucibacter sp. KCTC 42545 TaxID=1768242 RepID=UPI0009E97885|nr:transporter substrate-binding domain-containing protein [Paucibacter sp. KCTC 42545]
MRLALPRPAIRYTAAVLVWLCLLPLAAAAATATADLPSCSRRFTLAFHDHGLLYSKATQQGIDRDVADELIKRSGCAIETTVMPRSRIWVWIESGELDFSMSGISNEAREKFAGFAWYLFNKYQFLLRKDAQVSTLEGFERSPELYLGQIRSFRYSERANQLVDRLAANGRINEVADHAQLLEMMTRNRIQGMIIEPFNFSQVERAALSKLTRTLDFGDPPVLHGLIMSKKSLPEAEQAKWRAIIDGMRRDGTLLKIMRKYFSPEDAKAFVTF